jgi:hypothetical protein
VVVREGEAHERGVVLEGAGERLRADVVDGVAGEVEEREGGAGAEGARVLGGGGARDVVVREAEAGEARAAGEAAGEGAHVVGADAVGELEGAEGARGAEARGEVLRAVLGELVLGDVEVRERAERGEGGGEGVEVGASAW